MANPRNIVQYGEIEYQRKTYKTDNSTIIYDITKAFGSAQAGVNLAVTFSADDTVALAADGDAIVGILEKVEPDNKATVITHGHLPFKKGNGATLTRGSKIVGALGVSSAKGYVRDVAPATAAEINKGRGQVQNIADANASIVLMD